MEHPRTAPYLLAGLLAGHALGALGCGSDPGDGQPDATSTDGGKLPDGPPAFEAITPEVAYSGFDGVHTFRVPFGTTLGGEVTWSVADPAIAGVAPATPPDGLADGLESWAMVTTVATGTTSISAVSAEGAVQATLTVVAYDPDDYAVGERRYHDPVDPNDEDRIACASCHAEADGADHSPLRIAVYDDPAVVQGIRTGTYPDGYFFEDVTHEWDLTGPEEAGIIPYLRALPPRGF